MDVQFVMMLRSILIAGKFTFISFFLFIYLFLGLTLCTWREVDDILETVN